MGNLASAYRNQGQWKEAEKLEVQVMEMRKKVLGEERPDTLTSMSNLAVTYSNQGRWEEAEELEARVMEMKVTEKVMPDSTEPEVEGIGTGVAYCRRIDTTERRTLDPETEKSLRCLNKPRTTRRMGLDENRVDSRNRLLSS
ncbi:hypothetical protein EDB81DRAFT_429921 [Dactylonectria macrodidyma]|uniref:Kinesin light chain n=1 Tax=Dactylonectria macrodidyma TaxID=307937 RepID=A0A9P9I5W4_9HYPO|nr:hypothetical protein EDB81DRAFT_429921 [Dactylonectria macrodidyma]